MKNIGKDSGLDYSINVAIDDGTLTCDKCGRLPGHYKRGSEEAARRHLGKCHKMILADVA